RASLQMAAIEIDEVYEGPDFDLAKSNSKSCTEGSTSGVELEGRLVAPFDVDSRRREGESGARPDPASRVVLRRCHGLAIDRAVVVAQLIGGGGVDADLHEAKPGAEGDGELGRIDDLLAKAERAAER